MLPPKDIDKLGRRIATAVVQSAEDLRALAAIQEQYQAASRPIGDGLSDLLKEWISANEGVALTMSARSKTAGTIVEKIRRGTRLSTMQDIVGFRISAADSPGDFRLSD